MKKVTVLVGMFMSLCFAISSCVQNDDYEDDIDRLKQPVLSGLVLVSADTVTVFKGDEFEIRFRTNPSGVILDKENLELDLISANTYKVFTETNDENVRASYVTPASHYEFISLSPDRNDAGDILEGQWVAKIRTRGEDNFMSYDQLMLVASYIDALGVRRQVSGAECVVHILPTIEEGIYIYSPKTQNFRAHNHADKGICLGSTGDCIPYLIMFDPRAYKNEKGKNWYYDLTFIHSMEASIDGEVLLTDETDKEKTGLFTLNVKKLYKGVVFLQPNPAHATWNDFENSEELSSGFTCKLLLTDILGNETEISIPMEYYKGEYTMEPFELSVSQLEAEGKIAVNIGEYMGKIGLSEESEHELPRCLDMLSTHNVNYDKKSHSLIIRSFSFGSENIGTTETVEVVFGCSTIAWGEVTNSELYTYPFISASIKLPLKFVE